MRQYIHIHHLIITLCGESTTCVKWHCNWAVRYACVIETDVWDMQLISVIYFSCHRSLLTHVSVSVTDRLCFGGVACVTKQVFRDSWQADSNLMSPLDMLQTFTFSGLTSMDWFIQLAIYTDVVVAERLLGPLDFLTPRGARPRGVLAWDYLTPGSGRKLD